MNQTFTEFFSGISLRGWQGWPGEELFAQKRKFFIYLFRDFSKIFSIYVLNVCFIFKWRVNSKVHLTSTDYLLQK